MGRDVLAIEPFQDNILRIHKAVSLENLQDRIVLIKNAISNKRNEIKLLEKVDQNIGGQSLIHNRLNNYHSSDMIKNKYLVETILFDDIIDYIPMRIVKHNKTRYEKAILKIDIEGFEPYAFQYSKRLFKLYDVRMIFMEWGNFIQHEHLKDFIREMLNFFYSHNMKAFGNDEYGSRKNLDPNEYMKWPWDVYWEKS
jgi:FkbM family methyltransferase